MSFPKIRINCTTQKDMTINDKKINIMNYNKYSSDLNNDTNISKVSLIFEDNFHHNDKNYINKTLEFNLKNNLTSQKEFELFIQKLHTLGYKSKRNFPKIQYFNSSGIIEFNYNFNKIQPFKKKSVNNIFHTQNLYINYDII